MTVFGGETCIPSGGDNRTFPKKWHQITETFCVRVPWGWVLAFVPVITPALVNTTLSRVRTELMLTVFQGVVTKLALLPLCMQEFGSLLPIKLDVPFQS